MQEIKIFKTKDNQIKLEVNFEKDTVWLTISQMAELFNRDSYTIEEHIKNIYTEGELEKNPTTWDFQVVRKEGNRDVKRTITHYNLDVIISVGYRVKSQRGTQFRIWATNNLRNLLIHGYVINEKRLKEQNNNLLNLQEQLAKVKLITDTKQLSQGQTKALIDVINYYAESLNTLDAFDKNEIATKNTLNAKTIKKLQYNALLPEIDKLRVELKEKELFGLDKEKKLESILEQIDQSFNKKDLYNSVESKAAHLLYFIIKNHPFVDGNKRIGSFAFIKYLEHNNLLLKDNGEPLIARNTLVALALLIAQSDPKDKEIMIKLVIYLLGMR